MEIIKRHYGSKKLSRKMLAQGNVLKPHIIGTATRYPTSACTQAALFSVMGYSIAQ